MPEIASLHVYPIKSLGGISMSETRVQARGLEFDRRWMLVEADGTFITQRDDPSLVRFHVALTDDGLVVSSATDGSCEVWAPAEGPEMSVRVWNSELPARIVSSKVDEWFSTAMGRECHLVALPEDAGRLINPAYGTHLVSFADAMPILVLSESSVDDLNSLLQQPVPSNRFRANVILRGTTPYEEDSLSRLESGSVELSSTKRCGRCLVTCTDQVTGERGTEPLRTLAGYRTFNNNACMGMYFVPTAIGRLRVGDHVVGVRE